MGQLCQLDEQMEAITNEMHTLIPQKHGGVDRLLKVQATRCIRAKIGQCIRKASPWEVKRSLST